MQKASDIFKNKKTSGVSSANVSSRFCSTIQSGTNSSNAQRKKVNAIIANVLSINISSITQNSDLKKLGADSLDAVDIIMKLESAFNITIPDSKAQDIHTVEDIYNALGI